MTGIPFHVTRELSHRKPDVLPSDGYEQVPMPLLGIRKSDGTVGYIAPPAMVRKMDGCLVVVPMPFALPAGVKLVYPDAVEAAVHD